MATSRPRFPGGKLESNTFRLLDAWVQEIDAIARRATPLNMVDTSPGWDDIAGAVMNGVGSALLSDQPFPDGTSPFRILCMAHNANESLSFVTQLPHRWRKGTPVRPHLHIIALAAPAAQRNARFLGTYSWSQVGVTVDALSSWTTSTVDVTIPVGSLNKQLIVELPLVTPPSGAIESTLLLWNVQRLGNDAADTYTDNKAYGTAATNIGILSADVHFQTEKSGTRNEVFG